MLWSLLCLIVLNDKPNYSLSILNSFVIFLPDTSSLTCIHERMHKCIPCEFRLSIPGSECRTTRIISSLIWLAVVSPTTSCDGPSTALNPVTYSAQVGFFYYWRTWFINKRSNSLQIKIQVSTKKNRCEKKRNCSAKIIFFNISRTLSFIIFSVL